MLCVAVGRGGAFLLVYYIFTPWHLGQPPSANRHDVESPLGNYRRVLSQAVNFTERHRLQLIYISRRGAHGARSRAGRGQTRPNHGRAGIVG